MLRLTDVHQASADEPAADALLCLSGSHPARKLPGSSRSAFASRLSQNCMTPWCWQPASIEMTCNDVQ